MEAKNVSREIKYLDSRIKNTRTIDLSTGDPEGKRAEILQYFHDTFDLDEALLELLACDEAFYQRADPLRHPLIFYFGHTATFYTNKLYLAKVLDQRINPKYESMFAVGVDEMSWDDLNEAHYDWPSVADVQSYRNTVRAAVDQLIRTMPLAMPIQWDSPWWIIMMGIEHARIHLETSSVLIRQLPLSLLRKHPLWEPFDQHGIPPENSLIPVKGGRVFQGKRRDHRLYGWDNEYGTFACDVEDFQASRTLVSNLEFKVFVEDPDGYGQEHWWTAEGWKWRSYLHATMPRFWRREGGEYRLRLVDREVAMPWNWPVEVNYLEAKAFCNWKAAQLGQPVRLPTEAEWVHLRDQYLQVDQPDWDHAPGNINLAHFASSCPVDHFSFGPFHDVIGNVWQWTETPISGFDGFRVHPFYDDFSTPTFDSQHNLIKGGSWISTGNEATRDARYAFRRHFYQHAGLRYIVSEQSVEIEPDVYESDPLIAMYCDMHYGPAHFDVPNFPATLARICLDRMQGRRCERALDIGCATGRASFELARVFEDVTGLDFSARFIRIGVEMKRRGRIRYTIRDEGELESFHEQRLDDVGLAETADRVSFFQADACNLKDLYNDYDLVLAANLIDRLYAPRKFLADIAGRIRAGGLLVLASPYSWDEAFTPKEAWIGGIRVAGEPYSTLDGLSGILSADFTQLGDPMQVPFVIRETARKHQHTLSEVTIWQKC
jgi:5-histidylcysteine sulfoxide synthase/putative 4-mercaptohistidine N1-methyltranferase